MIGATVVGLGDVIETNIMILNQHFLTNGCAAWLCVMNAPSCISELGVQRWG